MATKIITSFFTQNGVPKTGLSPIITIIKLDKVNPLLNTTVIAGAGMTEVGSGWYRYNFSTYDFSENYIFTADGGGILADFERYNTAANESYGEDISYLTWEESSVFHVAGGTTGFLLNQISADTTQIRIDTTNAISLLQTLLKYDTNRTKIDKTAKTLTIYDNDNTTPIKVFSLKDSTGTPSITEIVERLPI